MPRKVRIINARDFISAKHHGVLDFEESEQILREVTSTSEALDEFDILVDTREAASQLSATDLWYLADKLVHYPKLHTGRTAILCASERLDHASFFALCAENKGMNMQAFTSFEEAITWLQDAA